MLFILTIVLLSTKVRVLPWVIYVLFFSTYAGHSFVPLPLSTDTILYCYPEYTLPLWMAKVHPLYP